MDLKHITDDFRTDIINWCQYNYRGNLIALAVFDPAKVDPKYPHSDINILLVVNKASEDSRERYELITEMVMKNIAGDKSLACRVQTVDELNMLAEMGLPLFEIYLRDMEVLYDPGKILEIEKKKLQ